MNGINSWFDNKIHTLNRPFRKQISIIRKQDVSLNGCQELIQLIRRISGIGLAIPH